MLTATLVPHPRGTAVVLDRRLLDRLNLAVGDAVEIRVDGAALVLTRTRRDIDRDRQRAAMRRGLPPG